MFVVAIDSDSITSDRYWIINCTPLPNKQSGLSDNVSLSFFYFSLLFSDKGDFKKHFHCHFQLPIPKQIIIFSYGKWEPCFKGQEIIAEVTVDPELPPQKIGTITSESKVICWDEGWNTKFLKRSEELSEQVMLQLVKSVLRLTSILPSMIQNFLCSLVLIIYNIIDKEISGLPWKWNLSGQHIRLAIWPSCVLTLLWPLAGFVLGYCPEFKSLAMLANSQLIACC